eukprot:CAMPEP_0197849108 /NCGR_PEP_ID=MMETSP1438-20131217/10930_1 /TAXON_ID=1461541 /ORGANISM="Pterosperma sp., Strain CCMP1384" /LENGTH=295 /DNA_ID=CAMNT_0043461641 /DNA_START=485 /DNA_END=1372 /DNA_ORIENTATION=+
MKQLGGAQTSQMSILIYRGLALFICLPTLLVLCSHHHFNPHLLLYYTILNFGIITLYFLLAYGYSLIYWKQMKAAHALEDSEDAAAQTSVSTDDVREDNDVDKGQEEEEGTEKDAEGVDDKDDDDGKLLVGVTPGSYNAGLLGVFTMFLYITALSNSYVVTTVYWPLLYPHDKHVDWMTFVMHAGNIILMHGDFFMNNMPFFKHQVCLYMLLILAYLTAVIIAHDVFDVHYPYYFLDPTHQLAIVWWSVLLTAHIIFFSWVTTMAQKKQDRISDKALEELESQSVLPGVQMSANV